MLLRRTRIPRPMCPTALHVSGAGRTRATTINAETAEHVEKYFLCDLCELRVDRDMDRRARAWTGVTRGRQEGYEHQRLESGIDQLARRTAGSRRAELH